MTRGAAPQQVVVPANAAVPLPYLRPHPEERALARVSKDGCESMRCLHPSRRLLRKLLRMRSRSPDSIFKQHDFRNNFALAAPSARGFALASALLQSEGAGNAGRRCAAAKSVHVVTTVTPETPDIPRAMVLRLTSCSPRRSGSFATVTSGIASTGLTPASRCQDHTTWPSVATSPVSRAATSTASRPDVRDVRETPL
jgi:hypothetical protein